MCVFACETRITAHIDDVEGVEQTLLIFYFLIIPFNDEWQREKSRRHSMTRHVYQVKCEKSVKSSTPGKFSKVALSMK